MTPAAFALCAAALSTHGTAGVRACALAPETVAAAEAHDVPGEVLQSIAFRETRFKPWLVGAAGERSAWQVLPRYCRGACDADDAARMLARWLKRSRGDMRRALAGFNAGQCGIEGRCGNAYAQAVLQQSTVYAGKARIAP